MKEKNKSFIVLNKILIGLIIIGLILKLYNIYLDRQVYSIYSYGIYLAIIIAFILPIIFLVGVIKKSKFYYVVLSVWTFMEAGNIMSFSLLGITLPQYILYNLGIIILLLIIAVISMILYIKSFSSVKEALS